MNFLVSDTFELIKGFLNEKIKKEEISFIDKEETVIFHMHGLAGFYGPKLILKEKDRSVNFSFKLFSLLENKINFQCDCKKHNIHMISEKDIPLDHKDILANVTEEEIKEIISIYAEFFKNILDKRDEISSSFFRKANVLKGDLIFNKIYVDVKGENREYRVGIKDENVYVDDIFNEGYFPVQSQFNDVFSKIYEEYMSSFLFENIRWFVLKKEDSYIKVDKINLSQENSSIKRFYKEDIIETCCSAVDKIRNKHLAKN